jgi:hypothetical protein
MRRAAKLMRARAEVATGGTWGQDEDNPGDVIAWQMDRTGQFDDDQETVVDGMLNEADAAHIASWGPSVALSVAVWLEAAADAWDEGMCWEEAGIVASIYLGESS